MRRKLKIDLYLPLDPGFALGCLSLPEQKVAQDPTRYTVERRGSCTVIWLGRGEDRTMLAASGGR